VGSCGKKYKFEIAMWVKSSIPAFDESPREYSIMVSEMPWMAANPSKSSSSFGDYPALHGAGVSLEA
jgi:hypothetical protein